MRSGSTAKLLRVQDLSVDFRSGGQTTHAVRNVSFEIEKGETLALVGESGSGKSVSAMSILRLLPYPVASHPSGSILLHGEEMLSASEGRLREIRGGKVGVIFQEPMSSLNPLHTIEKQISEMIRLHGSVPKNSIRERVLELLDLVGIRNAGSRLTAYPHELSGGQRQRVVIAMALANEPELLIADEPTTALDVTVQAQVMRLLKDLQKRMHMAVLLITHDLGVVRGNADRMDVMYQGWIVESGRTEDVFGNPKDEYTRKLIEAEPSGGPVPSPPDSPVVLRTRNLRVHFPIKKGILKRTVEHVRAVENVSLSLAQGRSLGVVGESGSGKSTLAFAVLQLLKEAQGTVVFDRERIDRLSPRKMRPFRREIQMVFQDPFGSLSPRMPISEIVAEGLKIHGLGTADTREDLIQKALEDVGLDPDLRHRYPHEFSGGQRQRIAVARALVLKPKLMILDEPTSSLDRTVQFQIIELLRKLQAEHGLAYLFISHDLKVVRSLCHEILVMRTGKVIETGPTEQILSRPENTYTRNLIAAAF
ncbi:MAG: ABC transporter ATP-binding protein [Desulfovibrionales bacterium]